MPYNTEIQDLIPIIINSKETIIRFYGDPIYSDFVVTNRMKLDLKEFMKTIKALQSVSYTYLDVYQRQIVNGLPVDNFGGAQF